MVTATKASAWNAIRCFLVNERQAVVTPLVVRKRRSKAARKASKAMVGLARGASTTCGLRGLFALRSVWAERSKGAVVRSASVSDDMLMTSGAGSSMINTDDEHDRSESVVRVTF